MKLFFTKSATDDLVRLREFIEEKNPNAAEKTANDILYAISRLKALPNIGRIVKNLDRARELVYKKYIVRYITLFDTVYILKIWHEKEERSF